jgi:hypothetical protein
MAWMRRTSATKLIRVLNAVSVIANTLTERRVRLTSRHSSSVSALRTDR